MKTKINFSNILPQIPLINSMKIKLKNIFVTLLSSMGIKSKEENAKEKPTVPSYNTTNNGLVQQFPNSMYHDFIWSSSK